MQTVLSVILALVLILGLLVVGSLCFKNQRLLKTQVLMAVLLFVTAATLRAVGQYNGTMSAGLILQSAYYAIKIFTFDFDFPDVLNGAVNGNVVYDVAIAAIAIAGGILSVMALASLLLRGFAGRLKCALYFGKKVAVFFGSDSDSMLLARDLSQKKYFIVMVDGVENKRRVMDSGFVFFSRDTVFAAKRGLIRRRLVKNKNVSLLFITPDYNQNTASAFSILSALPQENRCGALALNFYIESERRDVKSAYDRYNYAYINICFFSESNIVCESALSAVPFYAALEIDPEKATTTKPFSFFVGGDTAVGREFFEQLTMDGQIYPHRTSCVISDADPDTAEGILYEKYPQLDKCVDLTIERRKPGGRAFFAYLKQNLSRFCYYVFAYPDEELNLELARQTVRLYRREKLAVPPVLALCASDAMYGYYKGVPEMAGITLFGRRKDVFCERVIVNGEGDEAAQALHAYYEETTRVSRARKGETYVPKKWEALDIFSQTSNRKAIAGFQLKLRLLGLDTREKAETAFGDFRAFVGERLYTLAATEHLRWNAVHYMNGWVSMPVEEAVKTGVKKDAALLRHVCLMTFSELAAAEKLLGEPYILYDENNVLNIPEIYARVPSLFFGDDAEKQAEDAALPAR